MKWIVLFFFLLVGEEICAQISPVSWKFSVDKIADNTFELHAEASIQSPWHIYSMNTPAGGPTITRDCFYFPFY